MEFDLTIHGLAAGGWGVGRHEGKVVFVPLTAPGDVIRCAVAEDRGRFAFGTLVELLDPSPARVAPACPVFGWCGGCQWQHIDYERQLEAKRDILIDALGRIGRLKEAAVSDRSSRPGSYGWRAAVDLAFDTGGRRTYGSVFMPRADRRSSRLRDVPSPADEINARIARLAEAIAAAGIGEGRGDQARGRYRRPGLGQPHAERIGDRWAGVRPSGCAGRRGFRAWR